MPIRLCSAPSCPNRATYRGRCAEHARQVNRQTHKNAAFYNGRRWRMLRRRVLFEQPLCECGAIATDVDHIQPIEHGGAKYDRSNLCAMCHSCHARKTRKEQQAA